MVFCTDNNLQKLGRMVEKLQDSVLSITKENAIYKKIVEDLTKKILVQERRIETLERDCKRNEVFYPEMKTKKTRGAQNFSNDHPFVEGLDAKKTMPLSLILHETPTKRVVNSGHGETDFSILFIL